MVDICLCACITCCWETLCGDNNDESGGNKYQPRVIIGTAKAMPTRVIIGSSNTMPSTNTKINVMSGTDMSRKLEF